jgi:uridine kinase
MNDGVSDGAERLIAPAPLILVEGYLALWSTEARRLYDFAVFLDAPAALRVARRRWAKDPGYVDDVLLPMHDAYIEPTKRYADAIIAIGDRDPRQVMELAMEAAAPILPT